MNRSSDGASRTRTPEGSPATNAAPIRLRHRLEYVGLRTVLTLFHALPAAIVPRLAVAIARPLYAVAGRQRREAQRRVREVLGPSVRDADVRRIAWLGFRNLCLNVAELALARRPGWIATQGGRIDSAHAVGVIEDLRAGGRGIIVALVHAGNWDLAGVWASHLGIPGVFIARRQKNPLTDRLLNALRTLTGGTVVTRDDPRMIRQVVRALGENRMLAILVDLRARSGGSARRFLGKTAWLHDGAAVLARMSGAPILPIFLSRRPDGSHGWDAGTPIHYDRARDRDAEETRVMQEILDQLSAHVVAQPAQYFWYNKRWVLEPR